MTQARILVVDDDPAVNDLIQLVLREEGQGWDVSSAKDGEEAIRIVHEELPDLIILDMMMPRKNGLEVCRHVAGFIPVIMVSGEGDLDIKGRCLDAGAAAFISKPFLISELISGVKEVLQHKSLTDFI